MRDASTIATKKLYYEDAYLTNFTATVISFEGNDLVLDQTAFFPEEGGQYPDQGTINGVRVIDVQIQEGEIHHYLDKESALSLKAGDSVTGEIDFNLRYSNMQMHSGEHIFSGLVHQKTGYDNVGFHLSPNEMTMDFEGPISKELLLEIEQEANEAVFRNISSEIVFLRTEEERNSMEYRSKIDLQDEVRVVVYPGVDACACCAPHVKRTGEIGIIKVVSAQNWKGGVRVSLVCGKRASELLRHDFELLSRTAAYLSASAEDVYTLTVKAREENQSLKAQIKELGRVLLEAKAKEFPDSEEHVILFAESVDQKAVRDVINALTEIHSGYSAVFVGSDDKGWSYIVGSKEKDCREVSGLLKNLYGARGGGKPEMVQGFVSGKEEEIRRQILNIS